MIGPRPLGGRYRLASIAHFLNWRTRAGGERQRERQDGEPQGFEGSMVHRGQMAWVEDTSEQVNNSPVLRQASRDGL